jgi:serine O-acetyltransferase
MMNWHEYKFYVRSDLYRYCGQASFTLLVKNYLTNPGFQYSFWMRSCAYLRHGQLPYRCMFLLAKLILRHLEVKYGISISDRTEIGCGFYIGHFGGIVIHPEAVIGDNCNISQGVTIGQSNRGNRAGNPVIGNYVYIGPGAQIFGHIFVGDHAAIGANAVVTKDIPENSVVVGVPGRVISSNGSTDYVLNADYPC